jgi:transcription termination/antitermination protein NusA
MSKEILLLVDALAREKNVAREVVFIALELALAQATKRHIEQQISAQANALFKDKIEVDIRVEVDRNSGDFQAFRRWTVVEDNDHEEPASQIALTDAAAMDPPLALGDVSEEPVEAVDFGRIGAQAAKQVILQKIRDAERASRF